MFNKVGAFRKGVTYGWCINGTRDGDDRGMRLKGLGTFYASMRFEIIDADPQRYEKPLRCTTRAYAYKLTNRKGADLWRMHWHPVGHSIEKYPHVHIPPDLDAHMVCPRMTVEKAIQWCITLGRR